MFKNKLTEIESIRKIYYTNISSVISQVANGEGSVYTNLNHTL